MLATYNQQLQQCEADFEALDKKNAQAFAVMYQKYAPIYALAQKIFMIMQGKPVNPMFDLVLQQKNISAPSKQWLWQNKYEAIVFIDKVHKFADKIEVVATELRSKNGSLIPQFVNTQI